MSRNDSDDKWEKLADGSMRLVSSSPRVVSDEEIEYETARSKLRLAAIRAKNVGLTNAERDRAIVAIARLLLKEL